MLGEPVIVDDPEHAACLDEARRILALPVEVTGLRWHPFGVYTIPLPKRTRADGSWSRRLHIWHPDAEPVGPASPYGVHTHSGPARSHVVLGALHHHLYVFGQGEGWRRNAAGDVREEALVAHTWDETRAGKRHDLPADQPHGVSKPPGLAISLFEQRDGPANEPFTTWQRTDVPEIPLVRRGPVPVDEVQRMALVALDAWAPIDANYATG